VSESLDLFLWGMTGIKPANSAHTPCSSKRSVRERDASVRSRDASGMSAPLFALHVLQSVFV
jgi:hypothetical protein